MRIIKLTSFNNEEPIYVNVEYIGYFYKLEHENHGSKIKTNDGAFDVIESPERILKLIGDSRGI